MTPSPNKSSTSPNKKKKVKVFVGMMRPPQPPMVAGVLACPCGANLWFVQENFSHWQLGHFDYPVYKKL